MRQVPFQLAMHWLCDHHKQITSHIPVICQILLQTWYLPYHFKPNVCVTFKHKPRHSMPPLQYCKWLSTKVPIYNTLINSKCSCTHVQNTTFSSTFFLSECVLESLVQHNSQEWLKNIRSWKVLPLKTKYSVVLGRHCYAPSEMCSSGDRLHEQVHLCLKHDSFMLLVGV